MKLEPQRRLTDPTLKSLLARPRTTEEAVADGAVPGLRVRLFPGGAANWTLALRVVGEGGVNAHGKKLLGRKIRISLGNYPQTSLAAARAQANHLIEQAKLGINPKIALGQSATAYSLTVRKLSEKYLQDYVHSRELDSARNYESAFETHINPRLGDKLAELVSREDVREVMNAARAKRPRPKGVRGGKIGGVEAARTTMSVLRQLYSWAIDERVLKRQDNPASRIQKNLPKKKTGETVLSLKEARIVYQAAKDCGYPFGDHARLMLLDGTRCAEWTLTEESNVDLEEALNVIPADNYKSDHVHIVPLVPQAIEILKAMPKPTSGRYLLSTTGGSKPIRGISKFYRTQLRDQIIANTGAPLSKHLTSHVLRRTVATRLAELLGDQGDKLIKRVLGHSDGSVTAIYNRYGYVREMRRALEAWATELLSDADVRAFGSTARSIPQLDRDIDRRPGAVN
jgi:integrase